MAGRLGWSWNDLAPVTWRELNWAWEACVEHETDRLALIRYEIQKIFTAILCTSGVHTDFPVYEELNPLENKND